MMLGKMYRLLCPTTRQYVLLSQARYILQTYHRCYSSGVCLESVLTAHTVGECYSQLNRVLKCGHVHEAAMCAQYILAHVLGYSTLHAVDQHQPLNKHEVDKVRTLAQCSLLGQPIQYVLGEWQFRDLILKMKPAVFIPRPETEELVSLVVADEAVKKGHDFLEVGCGSGAICISLLAECTHLRGIAIDKSTAACDLTGINATAAGVQEKLDIRCTDINAVSEMQETFDLIVSNPPYIPADEVCQLQREILNYEDHCALDGGKDGMDVIRHILDIAEKLLKPSGSVWLEVDSRHPTLVEKYIEHNAGLHYQQTHHDFRQLSRFCHIKCVKR